jgi:NitT/TauT family transport system substrate-binding protein
MNRILSPLSIALAALALALKLSAAAPEAAPATPPLLKIGHVGHDHHLALYVAALEGPRFERNYGIGLKEINPREIYDLIVSNQPVARLRLIKVEGGALMPAAMSRGEIDVGLGGLTPIAKFADNGQPFKVICPLQTGGDMLVMKKGSSITNWAGFVAEAKSPGQPIQIGYKAAIAVAKTIFEGALKAEGITYGYDATKTDVRVILVNFASEASPVPLLESGALDGFVMNQPAAALAAHKGAGRVVADLSELPPVGKWRDHPCCCVAATEATLTEQPQAIRAFLKVLLLSTQLIQQDQPLAIECASRWTKNALAVEQASVPTVHYVAEPTSSWLKGFNTWAEMMKDMKFFTGRFAPLAPEDIARQLCDFEACRAAGNELRAAGLLHPSNP